MTQRGGVDGKRYSVRAGSPPAVHHAVAPRSPKALFGGDLDAALGRAADGVFALRADRTFVFWNSAAARVLGYTPSDVAGRTCCDIFGRLEGHGGARCFPGCAVRSFPDVGEASRSFEMLAETKAGRRVWLTTTVAAAAVSGGERVAVGVFQDATPAKELLTRVIDSLSPFAGGSAPSSADGHRALTMREHEILRLISHGHNTAALADRLHVSRATIRNHVQNIFAKLGVHSRLEAVAFATRTRMF